MGWRTTKKKQKKKKTRNTNDTKMFHSKHCDEQWDWHSVTFYTNGTCFTLGESILNGIAYHFCRVREWKKQASEQKREKKSKKKGGYSIQCKHFRGWFDIGVRMKCYQNGSVSASIAEFVRAFRVLFPPLSKVKMLLLFCCCCHNPLGNCSRW